MSKTEHLYLHIPFCENICPYCDFYSLTQTEKIPAYVLQLVKQMEGWAQNSPISETQIGPLKSIYFGGGTPSLLDAAALKMILSRAKVLWGFAPEIEISLEANPRTLSPEKIESLAEAGINRISVGIQSMHDVELKDLGRKHIREDNFKILEMLRDSSIKNFNIDLMFGISQQSLSSFQESLEEVLKFNPSHISAYSLIIEENTPYHQKPQNLKIPENDETAQMYLKGAEILKKAGYRHYEISNFCLPEKKCLHNLAVWQGENYLGIGPGAHSQMDEQLFCYPSDLHAFMSLNHLPQIELLRKRDFFDLLMLKLRLDEGIDEAFFKVVQAPVEFHDFQKSLSSFIANQWITASEKQMAFSLEGWLFSNQVFTALLAYLESLPKK